MISIYKSILFFSISFPLLTGCNSIRKEKDTTGSNPFTTEGQLIIADTMTVDVTLKALDSTSIWDIEQHKYVNQKALIDYIFDGVYSSRFKTFDFFTGEEYSIRDIQKMENEKGYSRDFISKIQFKEFWYIDSSGNLQKRIYSYTLGYEQRSENGTFLGHKALFTIKLE